MGIFSHNPHGWPLVTATVCLLQIRRRIEFFAGDQDNEIYVVWLMNRFSLGWLDPEIKMTCYEDLSVFRLSSKAPYEVKQVTELNQAAS